MSFTAPLFTRSPKGVRGGGLLFAGKTFTVVSRGGARGLFAGKAFCVV